MVRTQIQLTEEQVSLLKKRAAEEGVSLAEIIRRSVDAYLHNMPAANDETRRQRAIQAAGRFSSGQRDLADKHDEYLSEAYER